MVPTLMDYFAGFKTSVEEITGDEVEKARELEVEPKDITEMLPSHDKTFNRWEVASYRWTKEMTSWDGLYSRWRCCEKCWNDKDLEHYINLVGKQQQDLLQFRKKFYCWVKICYQTALHATEKLFIKESINQLYCCLLLRNCQSPQTSETTNVINHQALTSRRDSTTTTKLWITESSDDG